MVTVPYQFYVHSGAREQFSSSNHKHSIVRRKLTHKSNLTEVIALERQNVHKIDGTLYVHFFLTTKTLVSISDSRKPIFQKSSFSRPLGRKRQDFQK